MASNLVSGRRGLAHAAASENAMLSAKALASSASKPKQRRALGDISNKPSGQGGATGGGKLAAKPLSRFSASFTPFEDEIPAPRRASGDSSGDGASDGPALQLPGGKSVISEQQEQLFVRRDGPKRAMQPQNLNAEPSTREAEFDPLLGKAASSQRQQQRGAIAAPASAAGPEKSPLAGDVSDPEFALGRLGDEEDALVARRAAIVDALPPPFAVPKVKVRPPLARPSAAKSLGAASAAGSGARQHKKKERAVSAAVCPELTGNQRQLENDAQMLQKLDAELLHGGDWSVPRSSGEVFVAPASFLPGASFYFEYDVGLPALNSIGDAAEIGLPPVVDDESVYKEEPVVEEVRGASGEGHV